MVYYLKINRKEEYTFQNLQNWLNVVASVLGMRVSILSAMMKHWRVRCEAECHFDQKSSFSQVNGMTPG